MSNIHSIHRQRNNQNDNAENQRLEEASDWIAKLDRGLSDDEKHTLQVWLSAHPQHITVLLEVAQLWDKMDELSRLSDLFPVAPVNHKASPKWISAMAASFVLALMVGIYQVGVNFTLFGFGQESVVVAKQMNYQTEIGESNTIVLPDNSKIMLNTNSFVQVRYTPTARIIELQRGEIHIDVAHDTTRPLSVIAGGKVIQAVGTAFNVEVRNQLVELIVTDGKVLVATSIQKNEPTNINDFDLETMSKRLPQNSMAISKGEKVDLDLTGTTIEKVTKVDPIDVAASLSWRQGNLIFRGESLADAMAEISRYTNIEFELDSDEKLTNVKVAGMFKTGDVKGLLEVLNSNFNIKYERVSSNRFALSYAG